MSRFVKTCRHCLGQGCIHCNDNGQVRERVFPRNNAASALRRALGLDAARPAISEVERTLAFLRSK